jgi:inactivated superfamily I helicase
MTTSRLTRKQEKAISALVSSRTNEEAAAAAGVTVRTLYRWLNKPVFQAALLRARRIASRQVFSRLQQVGLAAPGTLFKVMSDSDASALARVRAAAVALDMCQRLMESEDLEVRLTALEQIAQWKGGK